MSCKLVTAGPASQISVTWPVSDLEWRLQVQTNGLNPSNWFDVLGLGFTNQLVLPLSTNRAVFYRLVYP
jgi:hypothetical protein